MRKLALACMLFLFVGVSQASAAGTWQAGPDMSTVRRTQASIVLPDGSVLVAGGVDTGATLSSSEIYDPAANTWSTTGSMIQPRNTFALEPIPGGKVLAVGGDENSQCGSKGTSEVFDPQSGTWTAAASLNVARLAEAVTPLADGSVLVAGGVTGCTQSPSFSSVEIYDPAADTWTTVAPMSQGRAFENAVTLSDGRVLVFGGFSGSTFLSSAEIYDPATDTWSAAASLPTAEEGATATMLADGRVLSVGGKCGSGCFAQAAIYDPATDAWTVTGGHQEELTNHTATLMPNGDVTVVGGFWSRTENVTPNVVIYHPSSNTWTTDAPLPFALTGHTTALLPGGGLLVAGGAGPTGATASTELFTPGPAVAVPDPPTHVLAAAGDGSASVSWLPPASDGGSPIDSYIVTAFPGGPFEPYGRQFFFDASTTTAQIGGLNDDGETYTFTVLATNDNGEGNQSVMSNGVIPEPGATPASTAEGDVPAGGSVTTDPTDAGPSSSAPVTTAVTTPVGGLVTISETTTTSVAPTGFVFGDQQVNITAPAGSSTSPLAITFDIAPVAGQTPADTTIYRTEGVGSPTLVPVCSGAAGEADPDPCVSQDAFDPTNTFIAVTVLTSTASQWNVATPAPPVNPTVTVSNTAYKPANLVLAMGATGTWSFQATKPRSVTDTAKLASGGKPLFDSGAKTTGTFVSPVFVAAGTYAYHSTPKGSPAALKGTVAVPMTATPAMGGKTTTHTLVWATARPSGTVSDIRIRFKRAGASAWGAWKPFETGVTTLQVGFKANQGLGGYQFSARLRTPSNGHVSGWSAPVGFTAH